MSRWVLGEQFRPVIGHVVLDGDDAVEDVLGFQDGHGVPHGDQRPRLLEQVEDGVHHQELLLHGDAGIVLVKCVLLQEAEPDHAGDLQDQFLVVREHVASDQLDDLQQAALLVQERHQAVPVVHELRGNVVLIPVASSRSGIRCSW